MLVIKAAHTSACFDAWVQCETLLTDACSVQLPLSKKAVKVLDECARICMGTFHALKTASVNCRSMALLCVGICEECAEVCEAQTGVAFQQCAAVCRQCATLLSDISLPA